MASITFPIFRQNFLKNLGGVIDEALKRGNKVNLLYDKRNVNNTHRGIPHLGPSNFPKFKYGIPQFVQFDGIEQLANTILKISDVVVLHHGLPPDFQKFFYPQVREFKKIRNASIPLISLQSHFYDNCFMPLETYEFFDYSCILSEYSLNVHRKVLLQCSNLSDDLLKDYTKRIDTIFDEKVCVTGSALFDMFDHAYKNRSTSKKDDVVLFVPKFDAHPFMRLIMINRPRWFSAINSVLRYRGRYLHDIFKLPGFKNVIKSLEQRVRLEGLSIVAKSRPKHGKYFEKQLKKISRCYYSGEDDQFYPDFTGVQILQNSRFSVHIRTFSVLEAVISGVPAINFKIPVNMEKEDVLTNNKKTEQIYRTFQEIRSAKPNSLFNYKGCVWNVLWKDATDFLDNFSLNDLEQSPDSRKEYVGYFCGVSERSAAERQMDVIEKFY